MTHRRIALLVAALCASACTEPTPTAPNAGSAHYTVTLLPGNSSTVYDDNAFFLLYRAGPSTPTFNLAITFGQHLEFDQCGLSGMAAVPGQFVVDGTGLNCAVDTPTPILLSSGALVPGVVDQSTSTMTLTSHGTAVLDGSFVINFRSSTGTPTGRIEGSFTATIHPCQSKVGSDGLLTGSCTLPQ